MATISNSYDVHPVVRPSDVKKICQILGEIDEDISISAHCSDGIERDFESTEELISYENATDKRVTSCFFISSGSNRDDSSEAIYRAMVSLHSNGTVSVEVRGGEKEGLELRDRLKDVVDGTRPWYRFASRILYSGYSAPALFSAWAVFLYYLYFELRYRFGPDNAQEMASPPEASFLLILVVSVIVLIVVGVPPFFLMYLAGRFRDWLFPSAYFAIGQGERRYETQEKFRWLFLTLALTIVVSAVSFLVGRAL